MKISYRKIMAMLLTVICVLTAAPAMQSHAETNGSASISVSASQVAVGESFTVTVTLSTPKEMICQMNLYYDSGIVTGPDGGSGMIQILETDNTAATKSFSYTFTSKAQGTASFRLGDVVIGYMDGDNGTASASSAITVQNPVPVQPPEGYSDVSLSFLNTSLGQLDPSAGSWRLNADSGVTNFAVDARASYGTVSVSGPFDSLQPGENWFNIHVVAMDGTTARDYPICVVRAAAAVASSEAPSSSVAASSSSAESSTTESGSETESETETEAKQEKVPVQLENGSTLYGVDSLSGIELPKNFKEEKLVLEKGSIAAAKDSRGLVLVYLTDESGKNGAFYIWDEAEKKAYPYVTANQPEDSLVFLALPAEETVPEGYNAVELEVNGKTITVYQKEDSDAPLYLVYGMNAAGDAQWYRYDAESGSFFRYVSDGASQEELDALQTAHEKELAEKDQQVFRNRLLMTIFLVLTIALLIGFIAVQILLLRAKKKQDDLEDELDELRTAEPVDYLAEEPSNSEETSEPETEVDQPEDLFEEVDAAPIVPEEEEVIDFASETPKDTPTTKEEDDMEVIDLDKKED